MKRLISIALIASTAAACADPKEAYNRGAHVGTAQALVEARSGWLEINDITASVSGVLPEGFEPFGLGGKAPRGVYATSQIQYAGPAEVIGPPGGAGLSQGNVHSPRGFRPWRQET